MSLYFCRHKKSCISNNSYSMSIFLFLKTNCKFIWICWLFLYTRWRAVFKLNTWRWIYVSHLPCTHTSILFHFFLLWKRKDPWETTCWCQRSFLQTSYRATCPEERRKRMSAPRSPWALPVPWIFPSMSLRRCPHVALGWPWVMWGTTRLALVGELVALSLRCPAEPWTPAPGSHSMLRASCPEGEARRRKQRSF